MSTPSVIDTLMTSAEEPKLLDRHDCGPVHLMGSRNGLNEHHWFDGTVWATDKNGPITDLLAAEITAHTGRDPGEHYHQMTAEFGTPYYTRIDRPATPEQRARLENLSADSVQESRLTVERITATLTRAPGNHAPIGGLKVVTASGWLAGETFRDRKHLQKHLQHLCREFPERSSLERDRQRIPGDRRSRAEFAGEVSVI